MPTDPAAHAPESPPKGQSRLAPVIERSPLPMIEVEGKEHVVRFVNQAFCTLLGKSREQLTGLPFERIVCHGPECVALLNQVYETGEATTHVGHEESDISPAVWLYAMWPSLDERQKPERVVIQLTRSGGMRQEVAAMNEALLIGALRQHELREAADKSNLSLQTEIAERRKAEAALQAAQVQLQASAGKLELMVTERTAQLRASVGELEAFAYSLAHDLRAPVRAIHGFTEIVLEMSSNQISPPALQLLQRVVTAATRMDSLIQDVHNLTHVIRRPITLTSVDVDALVQSLVQERPELSPPRADVTIDGPLLTVRAHTALLSQCLTNLLSNAVKFVEPGAVPRVRVWTETLAGSGPTPGNPKVRIWVEDQGIGIPARAKDRIFEIFQRLHSTNQFEGSGIGLAIVRKGVERMGGSAGFDSEVKKGSRFWLELAAG